MLATLKTHSTATEHAAVESEEAGRSAYFRSLAIDLFVTELTEEQKKGRKYKLEKNKSLTNQQRSWVNVMLRKNLGNARVGHFILNNGIPKILDLPIRFKEAPQ